MAQTQPTVSIADLERMLDETRTKVEALFNRRDLLQKEVDKLDEEIQNAANLNVPLRGRRPRHRRLKNETSLRAVVQDLLKKNKKGFTLPELAAKVTETSYRSTSRKFQTVVYQALYHTENIVHDDATGCYRLER